MVKHGEAVRKRFVRKYCLCLILLGALGTHGRLPAWPCSTPNVPSTWSTWSTWMLRMEVRLDTSLVKMLSKWDLPWSQNHQIPLEQGAVFSNPLTGSQSFNWAQTMHWSQVTSTKKLETWLQEQRLVSPIGSVMEAGNFCKYTQSIGALWIFKAAWTQNTVLQYFRKSGYRASDPLSSLPHLSLQDKTVRIAGK
jgi:hypothetical protein